MKYRLRRIMNRISMPGKDAWLDILECGHKVKTYGRQPVTGRRQCRKCGNGISRHDPGGVKATAL